MAMYLIKKVSECPACDGIGRIYHPEWTKFWQAYAALKTSKPLTEDEILAWWQEHVESTVEFYSEIPPDEMDCHECHGTGEVIENVPLQEGIDAVFGLPSTEDFLNEKNTESSKAETYYQKFQAVNDLLAEVIDVFPTGYSFPAVEKAVKYLNGAEEL